VRKFLLVLVAALVMVATSTAAFADDWNVVRLRGNVLQHVDGEWHPLKKGDIVPDDRPIATSGSGHAALTRGNETIELGPNTQIRINDKGGRKPFTTVFQYSGTVAIEAEVRNVQHFAVRNQYLAAVVKGTRFTVTEGTNGASVEVQRGQVSVEDENSSDSVLIVAGEKATIAKGGELAVSGKAKPGAAKHTSGGSKTTSGDTASNGGTSGTGTSSGGSSVDDGDDEGSDDEGGDDKGKTNNGNHSGNNGNGDGTNGNGDGKVGKVVETVVDTVVTVTDTVTETVTTTVDTTVTIVEDTVEVVDNTVDDAVDIVGGTVSGLLGRLR
jgi:hypothetical protein